MHGHGKKGIIQPINQVFMGQGHPLQKINQVRE